MNGFVDTALFLKIALVFDMETAFSQSPNGFIFRTTCFRMKGIQMNKLPWASKVGQKSSQTKSVSVEKSYEKACITVAAVFENMLPYDISIPHTETWSVIRMQGRMRMRIYRQTNGYADRSLYE